MVGVNAAPTRLPTGAVRAVSLDEARRLAVALQGLSGPRNPPTPDGIRAAVAPLGCLQLDPTAAVAPSHRLVVWSRVGAHDDDDLDAVAYRDRWMHEGFAHEASFVLDQDWPVHEHWCRVRRRTPRPKTAAWLEANGAFVRRVLAVLRDGPRAGREIDARPVLPWASTGWTNTRSVSVLLEILLSQGRVMVWGRESGQRVWALPEQCRPAPSAAPLGTRTVVRRSVLRALGALGVARPDHIRAHFTRGRYPDLESVLGTLLREGYVERVAVRGEDGALPGEWYMAAESAPLLDAIAAGDRAPRATLLSPFDNLICDRARAELLFGFHHRLEIYVPAAKRRWGYWVMPFLDGDRLVGRLDLSRDRERGGIRVHRVHWEPGTEAACHRAALDAALAELDRFVDRRR